MDEITEVLMNAAGAATEYLAGIDDRPVGPTVDPAVLARRFRSDLPDLPLPSEAVLAEMLEISEGGVVASGSPRYFGFVVGGALPAAIAADWLTTAWDQNAGLYVLSPAAAAFEATAGRWVLDALELPVTSSFAIVTGCQIAHLTCLAAARHHLLSLRGWDVERQGLNGAPRLRVLAGANVHVTIPRALRFLGLGDACIESVAVDHEGAMDPAALADMLAAEDGPTLVSTQMGDVNTGAIDPIGELTEIAHRHGAWLHVDGAFGLWARASRRLRPGVEGVERADSWATDGHKMLNVPYDCGIAICAHPAAQKTAMGVTADYLVHSDDDRRDAVDWTPEFSRRARGISLYAALRSLGRQGIEELVDRCCALARRAARGLAAMEGAEVLNQCTHNQVLVAFSDDERTASVIAHLQAGGICWVAGTRWGGRDAMRISVTGHRTTEADIDATLDAIAKALTETA